MLWFAHIVSQSIQVALDRGMEGRLVQLNFSVAFNMASLYDILYKLRDIDSGGLVHCIGVHY